MTQDAAHDSQGATKMIEGKVSRAELLQELRSMGIKAELLEQLDLEQLQNLASMTNWGDRTDSKEVGSLATERKRRSSSHFGSGRVTLTLLDKTILQTILASGGSMSSLGISRKLQIPVTAIQRRRKRLESEFLEVAYSLKLDKLGWRNADLLISTSKGVASSIGKELLTHNHIVRVSKSIGEHTIDLHAEIVFKNNTELLNVIEWIKSLDGVRDVVWLESVELVGKNIARPLQILAQL